MTGADTTPALPVPEAAMAEFARTQNLPDPRGLVFPGGGGVDWEAVQSDVRAIAGPVVAAELLRLVADVDELVTSFGDQATRDGVIALWERLRARASELDPTSRDSS